MLNLSIQIKSRTDSSKKIILKNPVMNAAGCFDAIDYLPYVDVNNLGAFVTKSITLEPCEGNEPPRVAETANGMINSIGAQNKGIDLFIKTSLPFFKKKNVAVIVNIVGQTIEEYKKLAEILNATEGVGAIELNISRPNVKKGGIEFGRDPSSVTEITKRVRAVTKIPLIVKISPNVSDVVEIAKAAEAAGADAVSLINTVNAMAINLKEKKPALGNGYGGLSGPAIKPIALNMVWQVSRAVGVPVIGVGGIANTNDALEFFVAGASAIQVGTANFVDPKIMPKIIKGIEEYFEKNGISEVKQFSKVRAL